MTELDQEVREEIMAALDRGDIQQIHDILDALEAADNPNIVKVEFTVSQLRFLEVVRKNMNQPDVPTILRMMVDNFKPGYLAAQKKAHAARAPG